MKIRHGMAALAIPLLCACGLLAPGPAVLTSAFLVQLDSAKNNPILADRDFTAFPDSVDLEPPDGSKYAYACTYEFDLGGMGPDYRNYALEIRNGPASGRAWRARFARRSAETPVPDRWVDADTLATVPLADSGYRAGFRDTDGKLLVLFRTEWPQSPYTHGKTAYQVFKEGIGLVGEWIDFSKVMEGHSKGCWLSATDGKPFALQPLLRRIAGMQNAFADSVRKDTAVLVFSRGAFDSVSVLEGPPRSGRRTFAADTVFRFPGDEFAGFLAWQADTMKASVFPEAVDTVLAVGDSLALRERPVYRFW